MLSLKDTIVTVDALNCQRAIAAQIVEQKGDYALALKGNQASLHEDVRLFLDDPEREAGETHTTVDLAWFAWIVARLGGWSGRTSSGYRPPGPKTMHHGLLRLEPMLEGWRLANRSAEVRLP